MSFPSNQYLQVQGDGFGPNLTSHFSFIDAVVKHADWLYFKAECTICSTQRRTQKAYDRPVHHLATALLNRLLHLVGLKRFLFLWFSLIFSQTDSLWHHQTKMFWVLPNVSSGIKNWVKWFPKHPQIKATQANFIVFTLMLQFLECWEIEHK